MSRRTTDPHLRPGLARYLASLRPPADAAMRRFLDGAASLDEPCSTPEEGRLLETLAAVDPKGEILELGTGDGLGTLHLARGAREGRVVSIDRDPEALRRAREALDAAGVGERVELVRAEALDYLSRARGPFQMVVVDVEADRLRRAVDLALPLLALGGRLAVLRIFGSTKPGEASRTETPDDWQRERLHPYLMIHPQLATALLPIGHGIAVGVKRRVTIREMGGPY